MVALLLSKKVLMPRDDAPGNLWLVRLLWKLEALQFGDFTMGRTAVHSPVYVNLRLLVSSPTGLKRAARLMLNEATTMASMARPHIQPFQLVAGVPFGGLLLATAFSLSSRIPMIYLHPSRSGDGLMIEGRYEPGQTVLVLDDLVTGGGSVVETAEFLREAGLHVSDAIVLVDRQQGGRQRLAQHGITLHSILSLEIILNYLMSTGAISEEWYQRSLDYLERFRASEQPLAE